MNRSGTSREICQAKMDMNATKDQPQNTIPWIIKKYALVTVVPKSVEKKSEASNDNHNSSMLSEVSRALSQIDTESYVGVWAKEECSLCKEEDKTESRRTRAARAFQPKNANSGPYSRTRAKSKTNSYEGDCGHKKESSFLFFVAEFNPAVLSLVRDLQMKFETKLEFFEGIESVQVQVLKLVRKEKTKLKFVRNTETAQKEKKNQEDVLKGLKR